MGFHFKYNASSAHRWLNCAASKALEKKVPERPAGEAALIGTAAHFLGEWALNHGYGKQIDHRQVGAYVRIDKEGDAVDIVFGPGSALGGSFSGIAWNDNASKVTAEHPIIIRVDDAMVDAVAQYTHIVQNIMLKYQGQAVCHVEASFQLAPDMGGSGDVVIIAPQRLIVGDYKNGRGYVDAVDNEQTAMYGVGALEKYSTNHRGFDDVLMFIVQPNSTGPVLKPWIQTRAQMVNWRDRFEQGRHKCEQVEKAMDAGQDISHHCTPGKWCKWCPTMAICPAQHKQTLALANKTMGDLTPPAMPNPATLDDTRLLWIAEHGDNIIEFIKSCKQLMTTQAVKDGKAWPKLKVVESVTKRRMIDKHAFAAKCKQANLMNAFEPKLKSISKLEKIIGPEKMAKYTEKPKGVPVLAPLSDGRETYNKALLAQLPAIEKEV